MKDRHLISVVVMGVVVLAMAFVAVEVLHTQTQAPGVKRSATAPRTPWGEPDLQGIWNSKVIAPLERPAKYADREFLTDAEVAALEAGARGVVGEGRDVRVARGTPEDVEGAYNNIFSTGNGTRYLRSKRTSLIIDPPNGKLPPVTAEGQKLRAARPEARFGVATENGDAPPKPLLGTNGKPITYARSGGRGKGAGGQLLPGLDLGGRTNDNPEDRNDLERCRGVKLPCIGGLCGLARIAQAPGYLMWYYEAGHEGGAYRTIPIDSRPHLPATTRLWFGDSVGHWEGDTLVVDTTNFTDQTAYQGVGDEKMHLIERFTRTSADDLKYQVTVDKPNMYARPWTMEVILTREDGRKNQIYESACYEGNYALTAMLAGARAEERAAAASKPRSSAR
jgi:hypothetical protein